MVFRISQNKFKFKIFYTTKNSWFFFRILIILSILVFFPIINLFKKTKFVNSIRYIAVKVRKIDLKEKQNGEVS